MGRNQIGTLFGSGAVMISLSKLDGLTMYLNEDLIESVEDGAEGQSAIHLSNGNRVIVAHVSDEVVDRIRAEKVAQARKVFGSQVISQDNSHLNRGSVRRLEVREP